MQEISPVTSDDLLGPVQELLYKFEVYDGAAWIDICAFSGTSPLPGWPYRKKISLPIPAANLTDFPVEVPIVADADIGAECLGTGYDIRFTAADGTTLLPYERESFAVVAGEATGIFWVKSDVATAGTYIWCYYGNAAAGDASETVTVFAGEASRLHLDGADSGTVITDALGKTWTANGHAHTHQGEKKIGTASGAFDGNGDDYLSSADSDDWDFGAGDFTVKTWSFHTAFRTYSTLLFFGTLAARGWYLVVASDTAVVFGYTTDGTGGTTATASANYSFLADTWYRIAVKRTGGKLYFYVNGVPLNPAGTAIADTIFNANEAMIVGRFGNYNEATYCLSGYVDEVEIIKGVAQSSAWIAYEYANMDPADGGLTWGAEESPSYLKSISVSLGGAGIDPAPIAATWSAEIYNEDGIFHPLHPTSDYSELFRIGRKVRVSIGGRYGGVKYRWQRLIGYMDAPKFSQGSRTVSLSGMDYTKRLVDTIIRESPVDETAINGPSHWGGVATFDSLESGGLGTELYTKADAVNTDPGTEADTVLDWAIGPSGIITTAGPGQESDHFIRLEREIDSGGTIIDEYIEDTNVYSVTSGQQYLVSFWARIVYSDPLSGGYARLTARQGSNILGGKSASYNGGVWSRYSFSFTALNSAALCLRFISTGKFSYAGDRFELDQVSIKTFDPTTWMKYELPPESNGPYLVVLDGVVIGQGDQDSEIGWHYDLGTDSIYFPESMIIPNGTDNLLVYYYTDQELENVLADLMVWAGLEPDRATALTDMEPLTSPGITIRRVWFKEGQSILSAVQLICERANYRFWFTYDGKPRFQPAPVDGDPDFTLASTGDLKDVSEFQDIGMVRNRISIEGCETAMYQATRDDKATDKFKDEASDTTSIEDYLEKTHAISNHLFQDEASITAMCALLLAEFKDPKLYSELELFANPVPLELGDIIAWTIELAPSVEVTPKGIIRDIQLSGARANYKVEVVPVPFIYGPHLYYSSNNNNNVSRILLSDFSTDEVYLAGPGGTAHGEFDGPKGIWDDGTYFYVADDGNSRVQKFLSADGSFVAHTAAGDVNRPWGLAYWDGKLYVTTYAWPPHVNVIDAATMALDSQWGAYPDFNEPRGMATDGTYLYVCDWGFNRVKVKTFAGAAVATVGSTGTGDGQFQGPMEVCTDGTHFWIADNGNSRYQKFLCSNFAYVSHNDIGFCPDGMCLDGSFLYVSDLGNSVYKYNKDTDEYIGSCPQTLSPLGTPGPRRGMFIKKTAT